MNQLDYCDRCGAIGKAHVMLSNGHDLVFCGHHAREYHDKLLDIAGAVIYDDETPALQPA
jgi:hypothetical protein